MRGEQAPLLRASVAERQWRVLLPPVRRLETQRRRTPEGDQRRRRCRRSSPAARSTATTTAWCLRLRGRQNLLDHDGDSVERGAWLRARAPPPPPGLDPASTTRV